VWDAGNNQCEGFIRAHFNSVDALDWSPNSSQIATASGAIRVWDSGTGEMSSAFGFYDGIIYKELRWFDPQTIATLETSYTKDLPATIRFWDVSTGDVKLAFRGWDDSQSANGGGMTLLLDDVKISNDYTIIQVSLLFDSPDISLAGDWNIAMTDSQGRIYPLTNITPETMDYGKTRVYQTIPLPEGERITLKLKSFPPDQGLPFAQDFSAMPGVFTFDPGSLQVGESMPLDEIVDAGFPLHLTRAQKTSANELLFEFDSERYYTGVMLSSPTASGSSSGNMAGNKFTSAISFAEMPEEPVQIKVTRIYYNVYSDWSFDFRIAQSMFTDLPPAAPASIPIPQPEAAFTSQDPLFLEVQSLAEKFNTSVLNKAGWVRVVSEIVTENIQPGQNYPPPYYREEQWFEINSDGWVTRNFVTHWGEDGNILQQTVSVGTHSMNLTTGEAMEFPIYRLSLDWILLDLEYALQYGESVSREETVCEDGSPCLLISMRYNVGVFGRRVWINMETGQQVKLQTSQQMPDGTETTLFTQTFLPVERRDAPPQEVLDVFSRVLLPAP